MDGSERATWETRFDWTLTAIMLAAYALAIFQSAVDEPNSSEAFWAALITGVYILLVQVVPRRLRDRGAVGEMLAVTGVGATLAAVALTEAANSGYILLVSAPIFFAAAFMGLRIGLETALLAVFGFLAVLIVLEVRVIERIQAIALFVLVGFAFSQARRLLVIERARSDALRAASHIDAERAARLEEAHSLLVDLAEVAGTAELSAVSISDAALHDLATRTAIEGGEVRTGPDLGVVAAWGNRDTNGDVREYPIATGARVHGTLRLWPADGDDLRSHRTLIEGTVAGMALAFDNIQLLQTVARRSVQDERNRVARELHDDIGPALASLGLVLDVLVQTTADLHVTPQLRRMRTEVTGLVERVRSTVASLRRADTTTVADHVHRLIGELGAGGPVIVVSIDERTAADGATSAEVGAIIVEAIRNAARHAEASTISIEGVVDGDQGRLIVTDDGRGFDADGDFPGHFGVIGMRERAAAIGGELAIDSAPGQGTALTVVWGHSMTSSP